MDWIVLGKTLAVAFAVGLDVLAISIGVGVARVAKQVRFRLGLAFAMAEIAMQLIGYEIGHRASEMLGEAASLIGFGLLGLIGLLMLRKAVKGGEVAHFDGSTGVGLFIIALSISLDSLGVGVALPAAGIPLVPILITVSITTIVFTLIGLAFGARLGERYEHRAEGMAGAMLVLLALFFFVEQLA
jgi:manganese efflux pump family protein